MEEVQSILVAVERNSAAPQALAKGIALADRFGARVELFLCDAESAYALKHEYDSRGVGEARQDCLAASRRYLESLRAAADLRSVHVAIDVMCESPLYVGIVHKVQQSRPDLVIKSIDGNGDATAGLSSSDWSLVRTCPAALLLTGESSWKKRPQIAAAVDLSSEEATELTRAILRTAALLKSGCDGTLEVLYGVERAEAGIGALDACSAALRERVEEVGVRAEHLHVLAREPAKTIPEFAASRGYDVLVLGALTHRKALTALVGTLTGRLMERLDCDFLLVKPATYECPVGWQISTE